MQKDHPYFVLLDKLTRSGIRYSVVGLLGASFYGSDQTTYDLDLLVEPREKTLSKVRRLLKREGLSEVALREGEILKPPPTDSEIIQEKLTLAFVDPYGLSIDVLTTISGLDFQNVWKDHQTFSLGGRKIYVASLRHILLSKAKANRPKDRLHLARLKKLLSKSSRLFFFVILGLGISTPVFSEDLSSLPEECKKFFHGKPFEGHRKNPP